MSSIRVKRISTGTTDITTCRDKRTICCLQLILYLPSLHLLMIATQISNLITAGSLMFRSQSELPMLIAKTGSYEQITSWAKTTGFSARNWASNGKKAIVFVHDTLKFSSNVVVRYEFARLSYQQMSFRLLYFISYCISLKDFEICCNVRIYLDFVSIVTSSVYTFWSVCIQMGQTTVFNTGK